MAELTESLAHYAAQEPAHVVAMSDGQRSLTRAQLLEWVAGAAQELMRAPQTIGLYGDNSVSWGAAFLAAAAAGKTIVPIPAFFSAEQCAHLVRDAGVERIIATDDGLQLPGALGALVEPLPERRGGAFPTCQNGGLIIYTSGSTGNPKGVRLESGQALWSAQMLAKVIGANSQDKYLSLLPLPMLLEIICGLMIPVLVGGSVHYDGAVAKSVGCGTAANIAEAFAKARPTTSVLVPQLLALYAGQLAHTGARSPEELRFVAVGGAAVPPALSRMARQMGIPVFEGYGLSECSSVVAVNRPGASREGTVGLPLPGLTVSIEDGEIVVEGPSVMDGYLHRDDAPRRWRTGDAGSLDADGFLTVFGRKDNLIVTPYGRNVSPEWIETMLLGDPRIGSCAVHQLVSPAEISVLVIPSRSGEPWFKTASKDEVAALVAQACESAPQYAKPKSVSVILREEALAEGLFTPNGRIRRAAVQRCVQDNGPTLEVQA